jgi:hypothetical protein
MDEIYVSTDVETDGPIPGPHSMLSLGSAAFRADKTQVAAFSVNLETLPGAAPHPSYAAFWSRHPEAWRDARRDLQSPEAGMRAYLTWVSALPGVPVFVAYPAGFDFTFVYWYLVRFTGEAPFSFSALDIKTYAMALLGKPYRASVKRNLPRRWFDTRYPHRHRALDDAVEQGVLFLNMLAENRARED